MGYDSPASPFVLETVMRITVEFDGTGWTFAVQSTGSEDPHNDYFELDDSDDVVAAFEELVAEIAERVDPIGTLFDELDKDF